MQLYQKDQIFALATATGGAIAIYRLSGASVVKTVMPALQKIKGGGSPRLKPRVMHLAHLVDPASGSLIDQICVIRFPEQQSYTGEEMVELHLHGSNGILKAAADILLSLGLRAAQAGEFTRRAFLNGKLSLSQAEAVREIIESESLQEASIAIKQLQGVLKQDIEALRERILNLLAHLEATLDYPEEDIPHMQHQGLIQNIQDLKTTLHQIQSNYERYKLVKNGLNVAIIGLPNAGKSSLLNALLKEERAIVTEIAGTTRDFLEESFFHQGIRYTLIDTAGLRATDDRVEKIGIERSLQAMERADVIVFIYDASQPLELMESKKPCLHVWNKVDLGLHGLNQSLASTPGIIQTSMVTNQGLDGLLSCLHNLAEGLTRSLYDAPLITNSRHEAALNQAILSLEAFLDSMSRQTPMDVALIDLYAARDHLGQITGQILTEDIVDRIFSTFCIGK